MTTSSDFEDYLVSKKIDSQLFRSSEPELWNTWKKEFEEMHPASFTAQKLNLINPLRRKYQLVLTQQQKPSSEFPSTPVSAAPLQKPGKPVMRPKRD